MSRGLIRVVKVGGSLLDWPPLGAQLWRWLQQQPPAINYLIAGGGELADAIRRADARFDLGEALSHRLCLQVMRVNGQILQHIIETARNTSGEVDHQRRIEVLDAIDLLGSAELAARVPFALPETWQVTSDSIAAYLADALGAADLVLLKSASLPGSLSYAEAMAAGVVDGAFDMVSQRRATSRLVCLRDAEFAEWLLYRV